MRMMIWNMEAGFGYDIARHEEAWRWLADQDPDVALLQEAVPAWASDHWPVIIHAPKYPGRVPWGCAIVSKQETMRECAARDGRPWLADLRGSSFSSWCCAER